MNQEELMKCLHEVFDPSLPRLGPGDVDSTRRALESVLKATGHSRQEQLRILDLGCGNGGQTVQLALATAGRITALDNHAPYLEELERRAGEAGVGGRIQTVLGDMRSLDLELGAWDVVWCEGALFVIGFREGLGVCRDLLAPGGGAAVSEVSWFVPDPPEECRAFFVEVYPEMATVRKNREAIETAGLCSVDEFTFPEASWWESYYRPIRPVLERYSVEWAGDAERMAFIETMEMEAEMYRKYSRYYGNVFFVMTRPD
ncbi:MAG: SAM-dependent methyltransferase [Candidatus Geothermincolia bacterium]